MTIQDAINRARRLRDTELTDDEMVAWLSNHDELLYSRVLSKYGAERPENLPYTEYLAEHADDNYTQEDVELMLPDKYGLGLYPLFLVMQIDLHHGDYDRYNNDAIMYNKLEVEMRMDYSREKQWKPPKPEGWPEDAPWDGRINLKF